MNKEEKKIYDIATKLHLEYLYRYGCDDKFPEYIDNNIHSIGLSRKKINNKNTEEYCIRFNVKEKKEESDLTEEEKIPSEILGYKTDVVECSLPQLQARDAILTDKHEDIEGGMSTNKWWADTGSGGTLGLKMYYKGMTPVILSNYHVLYHADFGNKPEDAELHQDIVHPSTGSYGDAIPENRIATLFKHSPDPDDTPNLDWAVAIPYEDGSPLREDNPKILDSISDDEDGNGYTIDRDNGCYDLGELTIGMDVQKVGATTGYTDGYIDEISINTIVIREKEDGGDPSAGGDSGSLWVDKNGKPVGLHKAAYLGDDEEAAAVPFSNNTGTFSDSNDGILDEIDLSLRRNNPTTPPKHATGGAITDVGEVYMVGKVDSAGAADNFNVFFRWRKIEDDFGWQETAKESFTKHDMPEDDSLVFTHKLDLDPGQEIEFIFVVEWDYDGTDFGRRYPSQYDYEEDYQFQTATAEEDEPTTSVTTEDADSIEDSSAVLNASIDELEEDDMDVRFVYRDSSSDSWDNTTKENASTGSYSKRISGLNPETEYEFEVEILYSNGDIADTGGIKTFTTLEEDVVYYDLDISISGEGSTNPSEGSHTYEEDEAVSIEATADDGWEFDSWSGDIDSSSSSEEITIDSNKSITANFSEETIDDGDDDEDDDEPLDSGNIKFLISGEWKSGTIKIFNGEEWESKEILIEDNHIKIK